jgi:hypothetical protein
MELHSFRLESARLRIKQLLTMPDLAEQAQLSTGEFLREFLRGILEPLIDLPEKSQ